MERLRRRLPSLTGLVAFEAAARLLSFTQAAREMCITQAAISRQVRQLEENLGQPLFRRQHRTVALTPAGQRLYATVDQSLERIARTCTQLRSGALEALTLSATTGFATHWLMPRLERFQAQHPEVALRLLTPDRDVDLLAEGIDVAFTSGNEGQAPGIRLERLFDEVLVPLCSPAYLGGRTLRDLDALHAERLLNLDQEHWRGFAWPMVDWAVWLDQFGHSGPLPAARLTFSSYAQQIQAALDGKGIAIACANLLAEPLAQGRLVRPLPQEYRTARGYYLALNPHTQDSAALACFLAWWRAH